MAILLVSDPMIITAYSKNHLLATVELGGGNFAKLRGLPGFHKWHDRSMVVRITGANIQYLANQWPEAQWIGGAEKHLKDHMHRMGAEKQTLESKAVAVLPDDGDFEYKRQPMQHQRKGFLLSRDLPAFGLFMEQGTGKTKVTLDTAQYLFEKGKIQGLVIVAWPNGVHRNWIEHEIPEDVRVKHKAAYWAPNWRTKYRQKQYEDLMNAGADTLKIFAFNVEAFTSEGAKQHIIDFLKKWPSLFVIDQSASIKNHQALRTKFLIEEASSLAPYRRILDGQPVAEGGHELYSQFKFLDPFIIGHDTWTGFKNEFCITGYFNEIAEYKNMDELHRRIDPYCYRVLADDALDLPPRIYKRWSFDLSDEERRIWDEMNSKSLAFFSKDDSEELTKAVTDGSEEAMERAMDIIQDSPNLEATMALVKNLRLQQIASGWFPAEDHKCIEMSPSRLIALKNLLAATEGKSLIFTRFRADMDAIEKLLGDKAVSYRGGMHEDAKEESKRRFMNDDSVQYFIGQPRTAGIGHTLTAASNVIFYCNDPSLRFREECEKRAHRKGQCADRLFIWDLIASNTTDLKVLRALRSKKDVANEILRDPAGFFLVESD